ncbi:O-antigen ligase family protein [Marinomonas posidonica]|uniref:O-antigen ligase family protein n=1 Tax=Marinomonas posidonica TaxID=936476 RepID=UPI003734E1A7
MNNTLSTLTWLFSGLMFALCISIPDGYRIGAGGLLLLSLSLFFLKPKWSMLNKDDRLLFWVFVVFVISIYGAALSDWIRFDSVVKKTLDRFSLFIFVLPVMVLLLNVSGRKEWLWYGVVIGAMSGFSLALYERLVLGLGRARGSENAILFGNISMLLGFLSLTAAAYFFYQKRFFWLVLALSGGVCGIGGSVLSGSRGGWVAAPLVIFFLLWVFRNLLGKKLLSKLILFLLLIISIIVLVPQTGVQARIGQAVSNITHYADNTAKETSVGLRFDMWKAAVYMFQQNPIIGFGESQVKKNKQNLADIGSVSHKIVRFHHAHNEFLDAASKRGLIGLFFILVLYLVPLKLFMNKIRQNECDWKIKFYAVAGALVPMSYIGFGFTNVMFTQKIGVIMYAFSIVLFWVAVKNAENEALS